MILQHIKETLSNSINMIKCIHFPTLDSTQSWALAQLSQWDTTMQYIVTADQQTGGRGSNNRTWTSPTGNVYMTFASFLPGPPNRVETLSPMMALAVSNAFPDTQIKWPNDLLHKGKKVGGLLVEWAHDWLLVGVGVNLVTAPVIQERILWPPGTLPGVDVKDAIQTLTYNLKNYLATWQIYGFVSYYII